MPLYLFKLCMWLQKKSLWGLSRNHFSRPTLRVSSRDEMTSLVAEPRFSVVPGAQTVPLQNYTRIMYWKHSMRPQQGNNQSYKEWKIKCDMDLSPGIATSARNLQGTVDGKRRLAYSKIWLNYITECTWLPVDNLLDSTDEGLWLIRQFAHPQYDRHGQWIDGRYDDGLRSRKRGRLLWNERECM